MPETTARPLTVLPEHPVRTLDDHLRRGGGAGIERAVALGSDGTVEEIRRSGLRGRGGGGFPTHRKWDGVRAQAGPRYVVANGAEGEPGTFKDRAILRADPYQVIEGLIIAGFAVGAAAGYACTKDAYGLEVEGLERAALEMQAAGMCETCSITVVRGPDAYLYGEEKAMLEVIEGRAPLPRVLPPYEHGLFAGGPSQEWESSSRSSTSPNATVVNNVETLAHVSHILREGADAFRATGTDASPGTIVCTVVGDVPRAGVVEVPMGTPVSQVIEAVGGAGYDRSAVKAVLSGVANPVLLGGRLDAALSYEGMADAGSGLGSAGLIVYAEDACMVEVARQVSRFLAVESCGQCLPCKEGSRKITAHLELIEGGAGSADDVAEIARWARQVTDGSRCYLATQEQVVVASLLDAFPHEVEQHLAGQCPRPRELPFPKLLDIDDDGRAVVDEAQPRKLPDWTYGEVPVLLGPP
ncbi:MAG: SLBB domain-containing protein [Actinomycetota bacterium]|nr:SLBB domain-containing protein [Actinomycetota bacterium]